MQQLLNTLQQPNSLRKEIVTLKVEQTDRPLLSKDVKLLLLRGVSVKMLLLQVLINCPGRLCFT